MLCSASKHRVTRLLYCLEMNLWTCRDSDDGENSADIQRMHITVEHPYVQLLHCLATDVLRPVSTLTMVVIGSAFLGQLRNVWYIQTSFCALAALLGDGSVAPWAILLAAPSRDC